MLRSTEFILSIINRGLARFDPTPLHLCLEISSGIYQIKCNFGASTYGFRNRWHRPNCRTFKLVHHAWKTELQRKIQCLPRDLDSQPMSMPSYFMKMFSKHACLSVFMARLRRSVENGNDFLVLGRSMFKA